MDSTEITNYIVFTIGGLILLVPLIIGFKGKQKAPKKKWGFNKIVNLIGVVLVVFLIGFQFYSSHRDAMTREKQLTDNDFLKRRSDTFLNEISSMDIKFGKLDSAFRANNIGVDSNYHITVNNESDNFYLAPGSMLKDAKFVGNTFNAGVNQGTPPKKGNKPQQKTR